MKIEINLTDEQVRKFFGDNRTGRDDKVRKAFGDNRIDRSDTYEWNDSIAKSPEFNDYRWSDVASVNTAYGTPARKPAGGRDAVLDAYHGLRLARESLVGGSRHRALLAVDELIDHLENLLAEG